MTTQPSSPSRSSSAIIFDGYPAPSQLSKRSGPSVLINTLQGIQRLIGQGFQRVLMAAVGSSHPVVQQRCDRHGQPYYTIYDPVSQRRTLCVSETEVRIWLEQRYYH